MDQITSVQAIKEYFQITDSATLMREVKALGKEWKPSN